MTSRPFQGSQRRQRFLRYIVTETLAGRGDRLKGYNVALEVFDRDEAFDSNVDPIVRIEAARLRDKLREYYEAEGPRDPVRIDLPKGTYTPHIDRRDRLGLHLHPMRAKARDAAAPISQWQIAVPALALVLAVGATLTWLLRLTLWALGARTSDRGRSVSE